MAREILNLEDQLKSKSEMKRIAATNPTKMAEECWKLKERAEAAIKERNNAIEVATKGFERLRADLKLATDTLEKYAEMEFQCIPALFFPIDFSHVRRLAIETLAIIKARRGGQAEAKS